MIRIFCDGLCEPRNPGGTATYGFVVYRDQEKIYEECGVVAKGENATNNVAEYTGGIRAVEWIRKSGLDKEKILLMSDSQLLIRQLQGAYSVRSPRIYPLWRRMQELIYGLDISFKWIPREENKSADALSRKAYEEEYLRERKKSAESCVILRELGNGIFLVKGRHGTYEVNLEHKTCTCFDWKVHREKGFNLACKHIIAVSQRKEEEGRNLKFRFLV